MEVADHLNIDNDVMSNAGFFSMILKINWQIRAMYTAKLQVIEEVGSNTLWWKNFCSVWLQIHKHANYFPAQRPRTFAVEHITWCICVCVCFLLALSIYSEELLSLYCRLDWPIRTISFSYDGKMLASASEDLVIDIAEVETGETSLPWL